MSTKQPKWITLKEWAESMFGEKQPHNNTLLNWVHEGRITPEPKKMGKSWFVRPNAEHSG